MELNSSWETAVSLLSNLSGFILERRFLLFEAKHFFEEKKEFFIEWRVGLDRKFREPYESAKYTSYLEG